MPQKSKKPPIEPHKKHKSEKLQRPTDKQIEEQSHIENTFQDDEGDQWRWGFEAGAKWVRDNDF